MTDSSDPPGVIFSPQTPATDLDLNFVCFLEVMRLRSRKKNYDKRYNDCAPAGLSGCGLCPGRAEKLGALKPASKQKSLP